MSASTTHQVTDSGARWWHPGGGFGVLAALGTLGAGGLALLPLVAGSWWGLGLVSPFQYQYAAALALAVAWFGLRKRWFWALLAAVFLTLPATRVARCHAAGKSLPHEGGIPLRVLSFNVLCSNPRHAEVLAWVRQAAPDVVFFAEVGPEWASAIEGLRPEYPYHAVVPREDNFGVAILSKHPLRSTRLITAGELPTAAIRVEFAVSGWEVVLIGAHPPPPLSAGLSRDRDRTLAAIGDEARRTGLPLLVVGDLNATPWCRGMRPLYSAGLRDARSGLEFGPTWRRTNPLFAIPIDHMLVKGGVAVAGCQTGPALGSDHRPLLVDLRL